MRIRIQLTSLGPYFLGGERIFEVGDQDKQYFIRSLKTPAQTTLFGILRYLGIQNPQPLSMVQPKNPDPGKNPPIVASYNLLEHDEKAVNGQGSAFKDYCISPLYLFQNEGDGKYFVPTPKDHHVPKKDQESQQTDEQLEKNPKSYNPYSNYRKDALGERLFPSDFEAKNDVASGWMRVDGGMILGNDEVFKTDIRVGIDKDNKEHAFVKKEFAVLKPGFSFVFFATVGVAFKVPECPRFVLPGFMAEVTKEKEGVEKEIKNALTGLLKKATTPNMTRIYAQSDVYLEDTPVDKLYDLCHFAYVQTRAFRGRTTHWEAAAPNERFKRYSKIATLIQAGSVFMVKHGKESDFLALVNKSHPRIAGFNHFIGGEET